MWLSSALLDRATRNLHDSQTVIHSSSPVAARSTGVRLLLLEITVASRRLIATLAAAATSEKALQRTEGRRGMTSWKIGTAQLWIRPHLGTGRKRGWQRTGRPLTVTPWSLGHREREKGDSARHQVSVATTVTFCIWHHYIVIP